jgi:hypothetical protein
MMQPAEDRLCDEMPGRFCRKILNMRTWQPFQRSGEQQTGQFSMQEMAIFGSDFGANQHSDSFLAPYTLPHTQVHRKSQS